MSTLDTPLASLPDARLSAGGLLRRLRVHGRLAPLVRAALAEHLVQEQACKEGLSVSTEELQAAANAFRLRHGLAGASDTHAWLAERGMSADDFEAGLEEDLLAAKLRQHLTAAAVDEHFRTHAADYDRLRLALVVVGREELAREMATQVRADGRALVEVAREQGLLLSGGGRFRKQLHASLAAALSNARLGELVGPVSTPRGFALAVVEERGPAELDSATRNRIQGELFDAWLTARMKEATLDLALAAKA